MSKTSISAKLVNALSRIDRPGTFCTSGSVAPVLPGLEVEGVGTIGLPLATSQLAELKQHCEQAPYGKGEKTLVDTSVRRVWRLTPDHFSLTNPAWQDFVNERVAEIKEKLGLEGQTLEAHLYDLLLYEARSFFLPHQDGEKLDRMVATLVVVLRSRFEGGELVVRHEGQEQVVDFSGPDSQFKIHFAAFYADCEHEVKPLRSGHRLCLIYNLVLAKSKAAIGAPRTSDRVAEIAGILREWKETAESPIKLAVTLEHEYTEGVLEWDALKGVDRTKAQVLFDAAAQTGFHAYLALVTFWESGSVEGGDYGYGRSGRYGRGRYEEDDPEVSHEISEVLDSGLTAENWRGPAGEKPPFGKIPVLPEEVAPPESLTDGDPEEDFEGYTGNAGMTLDRWYRHAAICLWPDEKHLDMLCQVGSRNALPVLDQMVKQWLAADGTRASALKSRCVTFAEKILANWPTNEYHDWNYSPKDPAASDPMTSIDRLDDIELIRTYFGQTLKKDTKLEPGKSAARVLARHGWATFRPELLRLFRATTNEVIERNIRFLERICESATSGARKRSDAEEARETCQGLAVEIIGALQKMDTSKDPADWRSSRIDRAPMLRSLVRGLVAAKLDACLLELFLLIQSFPERYPLRAVQLKALEGLTITVDKNGRQIPAPLARWITVCREQLESLTETIPHPPADLRRDDDVKCKCKECAELKRFLVDPARNEIQFRMAMERRSHVESTIASAKCDVDCKTVKYSNPHVLVCTKNTASYKRRLKQYHEDVERLKFVTSLG